MVAELSPIHSHRLDEGRLRGAGPRPRSVHVGSVHTCVAVHGFLLCGILFEGHVGFILHLL